MTMTITSAAFKAGQPIPKKYTEDGGDLSPPLKWDGVPEGTQELVLIVDDPDAPTPQPWVHWVLYQIRPDVRELPEGLPSGGRLANRSRRCKGVTRGQAVARLAIADPLRRTSTASIIITSNSTLSMLR